ncbi:unnamed protein product [Brassicogethes aeneus]|uniref:KIF-binding protein n=1 Tax=Brassicogethes aeneus TaxID=1431903 RepID=A0A9P0BFZ6_BRAAE|nr:unnamed protein product [Brassicogethes aeneus]
MTISKEAFVDLDEKYTKVMKLIEEDSKLDPINEPYLSKYAAREILVGMKANIENLLRNYGAGSNEHVKLSAMLGATYLYLGMIALDTDELSAGEKHLKKCNTIIEKYYLKPEVVLVAISMFNQFGIMWSLRKPEEGKMYLEKGEQLYLDYKKESKDPVDISDLFASDLEYNSEMARRNMEKSYTLTLYYLAQIFGVLKDALKSSVYCHVTLQKQIDMDDYDPIDWALNAATLSQFFMEKNGFKQARHHLACSSYVLSKYEDQLRAVNEESEAHDAALEVFKHRSADVARCWAKYGSLLLSKSKERLLSHTDDIDVNCSLSTDLSKLSLTSDSTVSVEDLQNLVFTGIEASAYELQVTDQFVLCLDDARRVFYNIQDWLAKAEEYYNIDTLASDYIEIALDRSQMYLNLLFFDENQDNQAKLHKRRIDLLEEVVGKINPQYYLQYCRQIWFELGNTYSDVLDIKSEKIRDSKARPKPQALTKANILAEKSIQCYTTFVDSYKDASTGVLPKKFPEEAENPLLRAYFHIAALHNRYITLDKQTQLSNVEKSLEFYKKIFDYVEENKKAEELIKAEYSICKEMVTLLPVKIMKLKREVGV